MKKEFCEMCEVKRAEHTVHFADTEVLICCDCMEELTNTITRKMPGIAHAKPGQRKKRRLKLVDGRGFRYDNYGGKKMEEIRLHYIGDSGSNDYIDTQHTMSEMVAFARKDSECSNCIIAVRVPGGITIVAERGKIRRAKLGVI